MKLDKSLAGWAVVALAVLCAAVLGVLALTPTEQRAEMLKLIGGAVAPLVATIGAVIAAKAARDSHAETAAQTPVIEQIQHQTNGRLDRRFQEAEQNITRAVLAAVRGEQG